MGSDIEQSFVVLMEVPRALWHWHGTDNRLVKFGPWVECTSLITITHQSRNRASYRSPARHVAFFVTNIIYLYIIYKYAVISYVNWIAFYRMGRWRTIVMPARVRRSGAGMWGWIMYPCSKGMCHSWPEGSQLEEGAKGEQMDLGQRKRPGAKSHLVIALNSTQWRIQWFPFCLFVTFSVIEIVGIGRNTQIFYLEKDYQYHNCCVLCLQWMTFLNYYQI